MQPGRGTEPGSRSPPPPTSTAPFAAASAPERGPRAPADRPSRPSIAARSAPGSSGATSRAAPVSGDLGEPAHVADHGRLAERQRGGQHARPVEPLGPRVREHDDVGAAEERGQLGVGDEARHEPDARAGARARSGVERHPRTAHDPQLGALARPATPRAASRSPCRGAAGRRTGRPARSTARQFVGQRDLMRLDCVRCVNAPWWMTLHLAGSTPSARPAGRGRTPSARRPRRPRRRAGAGPTPGRGGARAGAGRGRSGRSAGPGRS